MRDLIAIVVCALVAVVAAAVVWGWWRSPIPTFIVFTAVLHGMMLGVALAWAFDRIGTRARGRRALLGLLGGVVSVAALVFGQYVTDAYDYRDHAHRAMSAFFPTSQQRDYDVLDDYDRNLLQPATGRTGVLGYVVLKNRDKVWSSSIRIIEAILVIAIASVLAGRVRATDPPTG